MKKFISILIIATLALSFALFTTGCTDFADTDTDNQATVSAESNKKETVAKETVAKAEESSNKLGDYTVDIEGCRLSTDYQGKDVVIVKYLFTNVSDDEPAAFFVSLDAQVYQDGVGLNEAYFLDDSANYSSDNSTKEIKKGASIEVEVAYELNDSTTDIEVEVQEYFSFDDAVVAKTFSLQ
ncbi:MAG: DUF5067 domain-containing protein [Ruminococcus sp.]|nr:DUF5067 domain-containing protein [Ruminococcus sp.]